MKPQWQTMPQPEIIWDDEDMSPDKGKGTDLTWNVVKKEWTDIMSSKGHPTLQSTFGYFLGRLDCLVDGDYASWATKERVIEFVMEWRFDWPQVHDPAFEPLDLFLQSHNPSFANNIDKEGQRLTLDVE
jgi:hypothetical protein